MSALLLLVHLLLNPATPQPQLPNHPVVQNQTAKAAQPDNWLIIYPMKYPTKN
jgi:hypothetical protein